MASYSSSVGLTSSRFRKDEKVIFVEFSGIVQSCDSRVQQNRRLACEILGHRRSDWLLKFRQGIDGYLLPTEGKRKISVIRQALFEMPVQAQNNEVWRIEIEN
jgi:hypothetical protein